MFRGASAMRLELCVRPAKGCPPDTLVDNHISQCAVADKQVARKHCVLRHVGCLVSVHDGADERGLGAFDQLFRH